MPNGRTPTGECVPAVLHADGVIGGGFTYAATTARQIAVPTFGARFCKLCSLGGEADLGEAREDQDKAGRGVFLGLEAGFGV